MDAIKIASDETSNTVPRLLGPIVLAALALPGILPSQAFAEDAPEKTTLSAKYLSYKDKQKDGERISVKAPSLQLVAPIGAHWSLEGSYVNDHVSGASPRFYSGISARSGASKMTDYRNAGDVKVTRYFDRASLGVGTSYSNEHDYRSRSVSVDTKVSTKDNNTTLNVGGSYASDAINPVNEVVVQERKRTRTYLVGVTQALNRNDLVQVNLMRSLGEGYYDDPYKTGDARPRSRTASVVMARWNHYYEGLAATSRVNYRYYTDTFGIRAQMAELEWVQPLGQYFTVTPSFRYYTQSSALFYVDPVIDSRGIAVPPAITPQYMTTDQRLSAFGAITTGLKLEWHITPSWTSDVKAERYEQRSSWRLGGKGSPNIDPFEAYFVQVGLSTRF